MKTNDDLVPITDFILESERNLEIATAVYEQYEAARGTLVKSFFERLSAELKTTLPAWNTRYQSEFFTNQWGGFHLFKPEWEGYYAVRIEAYQYGESMGFGLWRNGPLLSQVSLSSELLLEVKKEFPAAKGRSWYEAEIPMSSPASDWRPPAALWRMHRDSGFLQEIRELLLRVVSLTERHVDRLAKKRVDQA